MLLRKPKFNLLFLSLYNEREKMSETGQPGELLLYRPAVHLWRIVRNWRLWRPCAFIVLHVLAEAVLALGSLNCIGTMITQVAICHEQHVTYYSDRRKICDKSQLPHGYYESCIILRARSESAKRALAQMQCELYPTRRGMWRHIGTSVLWALAGLCTRKPKKGGLKTIEVFKSLWTSGSMVATTLAMNGFDVTERCQTALPHFRNAAFLDLVNSGDFTRVNVMA
jgi:hypothetical protein